MGATVYRWASAAPPSSAYLDACFIVDLYQHALGRAGRGQPADPARASAAFAFLARMRAAGTDLWSSPLAIEEAMYAVSRSLPEQVAGREAYRVYRLMRWAGVRVRWPAGSENARAGDVAVGLTCRYKREHGQLGLKDALHAAMAVMDGSAALVTCDRHFHVIDDLTVFSYAPPRTRHSP